MMPPLHGSPRWPALYNLIPWSFTPPPRPIHRRIVRWLWGFALVGLWGLMALQSVAQPNSGPRTGSLMLSIDNISSVQISLSTALPQPAPTIAWAQVFEQAFHCAPDTVSVDQQEGWLEVTAICDRTLEQQGWLATGQFDFAPLLPPLRQAGVTQLTLHLHHQAVGVVELSPDLPPLGDRDRSAFYSTVLSVEQPAFTQLTLTLGYRRADILQRLALPLAVLLLPLLLVAAMRWQALRRPLQDVAPIWFGYQRSLNWIVMGLWIGWLSVSVDPNLHRVVAVLIREAGVPFQGALPGFLFFTPPTLVGVGCYALSHRVFRQIGQMDWSLGELMQQAGLSQARAFLPLVLGFLGLEASMDGRWASALGWLGIAYGAYILLTQLLVKALDMTAQALTRGELRDRVFALANLAGVKLQQVYLLPMKRNRMANAFAVQGGNVMLTDYLLRHLSKREVDAVMAHELAHLQYGHPAALFNVLLAGAVLSAVITLIVTTLWLPWLPWLPLSIVTGLLIFYFYSRRFEHQADLQAVLLTGDPLAMMTGLVKVARLNAMPLQWGKWDESFLTHPSMRRRIEAIAQRFDVALDGVEAMFQDVDAAVEHYALPSAIATTEPVFSTAAKQATAMKLLWSVLGVISITPVGVARLLPATAAGWQWLGYLGGAILTIALLLAVLNWLPVMGYQRWGHQLRHRLQQAGLLTEDEQAVLVGLSPHAEPRLYEGFYDWDLGFLVMQGDRLCYIGEHLQFSLSPNQIVGIALGKAAPSWWRSPRIYLSWQGDRSTGVFNLRPAQVAALHQLPAATRALKQRLQQWWEQPPQAPVPAPLDLPPPTVEAVTSMTPREAIAPNLAGYLILVTLMVLALGLALGLSTPRLVYAVGVALAALMVQFWPLWSDRPTD